MKLEKKLSNLKAVFTAKEDCPINEAQTHVFYNGVWREISEDQDGEKYIMYGMQTCYFTTKGEETDSLEGFTDGSWYIGGQNTIRSHIEGEKAWEDNTVCVYTGRNEANAYLIAASKDMYRALKAFMKLVDGISVVPYGTKLTVTIDAQLFENASKAINKATPKK